MGFFDGDDCTEVVADSDGLGFSVCGDDCGVTRYTINNPPTKAGNGGFPANAQGLCYAQAAGVAGQ